MIFRLTGALTVCAVALLAACSRGDPDVLAMKMELHALKHELDYVRQQTEDLDPRVRTAEQLAMQAIDEREAPLALDCAGHRPGMLVTRLATLTAICDGIEPTPDGVRLKLKLGNPTSGRIEGLRLTFYAGEGAAHGRSELRIFQQVRTALAPGTWKPLEIDLTGAPGGAAEFALRAQVDTIALAQQ
jgi:hypothetical protein